MKRHLIYGRYGVNDTATVLVRDDELSTELNLLTAQNKLGHGVGTLLDNLSNMGILPSIIGVDLLVFATHVQAADTRISREGESQDSWTREIRLVVPVTDPDVWERAAQTIKRALDFLTGDLWTVEFRSKPKKMPGIIPAAALTLQGVPFDELSLFSGGLDSLIGAVDLLEAGRTPLLISHAGESVTSTAQAKCLKLLKEQYNTNQFAQLRLWMNLEGVEVKGSAHEMTMRARSFLFFATGICAGTGFDKPITLRVPENGLIALNVPLDPLRLGSHSTRTTHPFYIARWNELLKILGIEVNIENPYWDKTKGEMASGCANKALLERVVPGSMSCSHPTEATRHHLPPQHCGYCLPCIIRRAALVRGFGANTDKTTYKLDDLTARPLDSTRAEGVQIRSFQYAIHRLRARPQLATTLIHLNGSLSDEDSAQQEALADVYSRGLEEVSQILKGVHTKAK